MVLRFPLLFSILSIAGAAFAGAKHNHAASAQVGITTRVLDVNRFNIQITDRGGLTVNSPGNGGGIWWFSDTVQNWVVYDQGPWIIGKMNGRPAMGASYWGTSYVPGPIIDGRPALEISPGDSARFHPYKISRTSSSSDPDVLQWPADLGAPTDPDGKPLLLGDELVWSVFNGADSSVIPRDWNSTKNFPHLPVEIHQAFYARAGSRSDTSLMANTAFMEWTFINKGSSVIESCYVGLWTDLDVGLFLLNPFSIDTTTQTGYLWDGVLWDTLYYVPKAAGYTLLYGPRVPDASSSALFRGRWVPGYRNLPLSSFWGMSNDYGPPSGFPIGPNTIEEAWNISRGLDKSGQVIIDSVTKLPTRFPWSGDPLTGMGWLYTGSTGGEAGFLFFSGPFTLAPGDTQWTMLALLPAASRDEYQAIRTVRNNAARLRALTYEEIALPRPLAVRENAGLPLAPELFQNYPNPFNPKTVVSSQLPVASYVRLVVYDLLGREVAVLANELRAAGSYRDTFDGSRLSSGVYIYRLSAGSFVASRRMVLIK